MDRHTKKRAAALFFCAAFVSAAQELFYNLISLFSKVYRENSDNFVVEIFVDEYGAFVCKRK